MVTLISLLFAHQLVLSPDVADLLPTVDEGAELRDYMRVFGKGDVATVFVYGADAQGVRVATDDAVEALRKCDKVRAALDRVQFEVPGDPSLVWGMVGPKGHEKLQSVFEPHNMEARIQDSKRLLLTPGAASFSGALRRDPLRLRTLPFEHQVQVTGAAKASASTALSSDPLGTLVAKQGRARLILLSATGQSLRGSEAKGFSQAVQEALNPVRKRHPRVTLELTGAHAIATETEAVLRRDLYVSGLLSTFLVSLAFVLTFRRTRALVAILPPLGLGTIWTAAAAYLVFGRVSALTLGFIAVVVGVGLDTGVHVYASLLMARRSGMSPREASVFARKDTAKPTLVAALTAAIAFGSLVLSRVPALQQFGVLCAAGELLTSFAILAVTPSVGAWLERGKPPEALRPRWIAVIDRHRRSALAPVMLAIGAFVPLYVFFTLGAPKLGGAIVAIRPGNLHALEVQDKVNETFGGGESQWVVMLRDRDEPTVRTRADKVFDALDSAQDHVVAIDGLTRFAPSLQTQRERLAVRDALDLPQRAKVLEKSLENAGFQVDAFSDALRVLRSPSQHIADALQADTQANRLFRARYLAHDSGEVWSAMYVQVRPGSEEQVERLIANVDGAAVVTGYARLETVLAQAVRSDLPKVMGVAALLVALAILLTLRRVRDGVVALSALAFGVAWVVALVRWWPLPIHIYNAFVIPVLLGISVDEVMFLLHRKRQGSMRQALDVEGPVVVATAVTTSAGFLALVVCSFQGLRDMGVLGAMGSLSGLLAALWVVPVLATRRTSSGGDVEEQDECGGDEQSAAGGTYDDEGVGG